MLFCLDTNVFITSKNFYYPFDFAPAYWEMLEQNFKSGTIFSHSEVYKELTRGDDELSQYMKDNKELNWFLEIVDEDTQNVYAQIVRYVYANYKENEAIKFMSGADPWLIAACKTREATLVTKELYKPEAKKVLIPNICKQFDVDYIDDFAMIRELKAKFVLE